MGLFRKIFGRGQYPAPNPMDRVDGIEAPHMDDCSYNDEIEERIQAAEEGARIRAERMSNQKVDTSMFTRDKINNDMVCILDEFSPSWRKMGLDVSKAYGGGSFSNLTKAGKVPKNVYEGGFTITRQRGNSEDTVTASVKYLIDGTVNSSDVHLWRDHVRVTYRVRIVDGRHAVTFIEAYELKKDLRTLVYSNRDANFSGDPTEILSNALMDYLHI